MDLRLVFVPPLLVFLTTGMGAWYREHHPDSQVAIDIARGIVWLGVLGGVALVGALIACRHARNFRAALVGSLISLPVTACLTFLGFMAVGF